MGYSAQIAVVAADDEADNSISYAMPVSTSRAKTSAQRYRGIKRSSGSNPALFHQCCNLDSTGSSLFCDTLLSLHY